MKKFALAIVLTALLIGKAHADSSERVVLEDVIGRRNVVITHPLTDEKIFLHLKTGCGELAKGQTVHVAITGSLNGNSDFLKIDDVHQCAIDQVEPFTQKLYVHYFTTGNSEILISDEAGQEYLLGYGDLCKAMPQFRESWIFVAQGDQTLAESDRLFLPDLAGECSIDRLEKRTASTPSSSTVAGDRQLPTGVTGLKAILGNRMISLTWKPARDDHGISHYLVSYDLNLIDPKEIPTQDMPNLTKTPSTQLNITGLENNQRYYFYVSAVDTGGNRSSEWATAQATPKDIVARHTPTPPLNIRIEREASKSFFLRWDRISTVTRHFIALDVDGKRAFSNVRYLGKTLQVNKTAARKGKKMTLTVRAIGLYGLIKEEKFEFKFE